MLPMLLGVLFLALGLALVLRNWGRQKTWQSASAVAQVREIEVSKSLDGSTRTYQRIRYRFADRDGKLHSFDIRDYVGIRNTGQEVIVFYDPDNPNKALIATARDLYGWACGLCLFGLAFIVVGFFI